MPIQCLGRANPQETVEQTECLAEGQVIVRCSSTTRRRYEVGVWEVTKDRRLKRFTKSFKPADALLSGIHIAWVMKTKVETVLVIEGCSAKYSVKSFKHGD